MFETTNINLAAYLLTVGLKRLPSRRESSERLRHGQVYFIFAEDELAAAERDRFIIDNPTVPIRTFLENFNNLRREVFDS